MGEGKEGTKMLIKAILGLLIIGLAAMIVVVAWRVQDAYEGHEDGMVGPITDESPEGWEINAEDVKLPEMSGPRDAEENAKVESDFQTEAR